MQGVAELLARRNAVFGEGTPIFYDEPLHLVRGEGVNLYDPDGRRYVDMYNNVPCVGHANSAVVAAMARQAGLLNVHSRYLHHGVVEFAETFLALHPDHIDTVIFSCTGTEANDVALRIAQMATGKRGILCTNATYHGNSDLVIQLTNVGTMMPPSATVQAFPFPEKFRPPQHGLSDEALCNLYLAEMDAAIDRLEASGAGFAAFLACSIFANEGLPDVPQGFMPRATELVHRRGGMIIADEVQSGYGRTGQWWGYQTMSFTPDIITTGKPMGNGLPLAATAAPAALISDFRKKTEYFNTYASSPLQAAVGMAVIDEIGRLDLLANAAARGAALRDGLRARMARWPAIGDVRGLGLFLSIEIIDPAEPEKRLPNTKLTYAICNALKAQGYLTATAGLANSIVKIRPPLVLSAENVTGFLAAFDTVMTDLHGA